MEDQTPFEMPTEQLIAMAAQFVVAGAKPTTALESALAMAVALRRETVVRERVSETHDAVGTIDGDVVRVRFDRHQGGRPR